MLSLSTVSLVPQPQNGVGRTTWIKQNMGIVTLRATQNSSRGNYGQYGDRCVPQKPAQRTDVSYMFGHVKEDNDNQGMFTQVLFRLYCDCSPFRKQGMSYLSKKVSVKEIFET